MTRHNIPLHGASKDESSSSVSRSRSTKRIADILDSFVEMYGSVADVNEQWEDGERMPRIAVLFCRHMRLCCEHMGPFVGFCRQTQTVFLANVTFSSIHLLLRFVANKSPLLPPLLPHSLSFSLSLPPSTKPPSHATPLPPLFSLSPPPSLFPFLPAFLFAPLPCSLSSPLPPVIDASQTAPSTRPPSLFHLLLLPSSCLHKCVHGCMFACLTVCRVFVCLFVSIFACMYVCIYVCIHACLYVCMYVCIHIRR